MMDITQEACDQKRMVRGQTQSADQPKLRVKL